MSLLVEYSLLEGKAAAQKEALNQMVSELKTLGDQGFDYTAYESDDPTRFFAVLEFDNGEAKQRFLGSDAFAKYRDGAKARFTGTPGTRQIRLVATTRS